MIKAKQIQIKDRILDLREKIEKQKNTLQKEIELKNKRMQEILNFKSSTNEILAIITSPINNLNYSIILYGKNRCKKIITQRVV